MISNSVSKKNWIFKKYNKQDALFYKEKECCWILNQETFEDNIEQLLTNILSNNSEFLQKKENLKKLNYKNTWTNVNQKILNIINEN